MKRQGAYIWLRAHILALIRLWNWRLYVCCTLWSYDTPWIRFLPVAARRPAGTSGKPWCLSTSCVFITVKPPSKLTAPRIAVCAAGSAVSMETQKKIRERTGGSTCPLVVEKSNRRHVCLSLGQRLTQWQLLDQWLQTGCWFDSPLCSHDLLSGPLVWKLQQIGGCRVHHTDPGTDTEKRAQDRFKTCQISHTSALNPQHLYIFFLRFKESSKLTCWDGFHF